MAFPNINAQQETNRKILEDLQLKKQLLQKGVSPANLTSPSMTQFMPTNQQTSNIQAPDQIPLNSTARTAWQQATTQSFGFFIPTDSAFGNIILPVLPRCDTPK
ncbi:SOSS complex subunit C homolog B [Condylostylus longicornis]|uniref:SOSS complex subunit C homolog B n=1 Tax=Condylostylus longicornis TaxID=2530218 RepID=UPI00244E3B69|nr:SOSS complex subunit C homolog B [Condylostylus longicornis]XP_055370863.1 SOSS complex subunit C homolog B [Condylostylus longicornis]